ncbi:hypothetical protein I4U23_026367 [Adineta vaga]|nr:hypothetical protein I4U23_026367 [Adineta vaga]
MRLKTLRKNRPPLEIEGAVLSGNRMDIVTTDLRTVHHRSNTSFALPTSLEKEIAYSYLSPYDQMHEISSHSFQDPDLLTASQSTDLSSYKAIQQAYLQHGIRIRLSQRKASSATRSRPERKSIHSARPHTANIRQQSAKPTNVLQDATTKQNEDHDAQSFSTPQQTSLNDFEQIHVNNVSDDELQSPINDEIPEDYYSTSFITSQHFHLDTPQRRTQSTNPITPTTTILDDDDPDIIYMSSLLKIASVESFRDTNCRQSAVRRTFSARPYSLNDRSMSSKQKESRERSPINQRHTSTQSTTNTPISTVSSKKIDNDIRKHASRMQHPSKEYIAKCYGAQATRIGSASSRDISTPTVNTPRKNSKNKTLKSNSLEPFDHLLTPYQRSTSLSIDDFPITKTVSMNNNRKSSSKHSKPTAISTDENQSHSVTQENSTSPSIANKGEFSLMQTSPNDLAPQSNVYDSHWHDCSNSIECDGRSLTSSSIVQIPSSILTGQLAASASRRTQKRVSFYEEPRPVVLTTTTYV